MAGHRGNESLDLADPQHDDESERDPDDILREVQAVLRVRRWEAREEPFRGFSSPRGKF